MNITRLQAWLRRPPSDYSDFAIIFCGDSEEVVLTWQRDELPQSEGILAEDILKVCQDYANDKRTTCRFRVQFQKDGNQLKATGIISRAVDSDDPLNVDTDGRDASSQMVRMNEVQLRLVVGSTGDVIRGFKEILTQVRDENRALREENKALREMMIAKLSEDADAEKTEIEIKQQQALDKFMQLAEKYGPGLLAKYMGPEVSPINGGNGHAPA